MPPLSPEKIIQDLQNEKPKNVFLELLDLDPTERGSLINRIRQEIQTGDPESESSTAIDLDRIEMILQKLKTRKNTKRFARVLAVQPEATRESLSKRRIRDEVVKVKIGDNNKELLLQPQELLGLEDFEDFEELSVAQVQEEITDIQDTLDVIKFNKDFFNDAAFVNFIEFLSSQLVLLESLALGQNEQNFAAIRDTLREAFQPASDGEVNPDTLSEIAADLERTGPRSLEDALSGEPDTSDTEQDDEEISQPISTEFMAFVAIGSSVFLIALVLLILNGNKGPKNETSTILSSSPTPITLIQEEPTVPPISEIVVTEEVIAQSPMEAYQAAVEALQNRNPNSTIVNQDSRAIDDTVYFHAILENTEQTADEDKITESQLYIGSASDSGAVSMNPIINSLQANQIIGLSWDDDLTVPSATFVFRSGTDNIRATINHESGEVTYNTDDLIYNYVNDYERENGEITHHDKRLYGDTHRFFFYTQIDTESEYPRFQLFTGFANENGDLDVQPVFTTFELNRLSAKRWEEEPQVTFDIVSEYGNPQQLTVDLRYQYTELNQSPDSRYFDTINNMQERYGEDAVIHHDSKAYGDKLWYFAFVKNPYSDLEDVYVGYSTEDSSTGLQPFLVSDSVPRTNLAGNRWLSEPGISVSFRNANTGEAEEAIINFE